MYDNIVTIYAIILLSHNGQKSGKSVAHHRGNSSISCLDKGFPLDELFIMNYHKVGVLVASGPNNHYTNQVHFLILPLCMMRWALIRRI